MVKAAVVGARGYLGRELVRFLVGHPNIDAVVPVTTGAGGPYGDAVPAFRHRRDLVMVPEGAPGVRDADVHFLATDAAQATAHVAAHGETTLIVDLSRAHRGAAFEAGSGWRYGLPELFPVPKGTPRIANPGCYPTATLLAAQPALRAGLAAPGWLIADGKSGVSGAGAAARADLHFPEANEAVRAYKVLGHDHQEEMRLAVAKTEGAARPVRFTPHLVPQNRGLLSTVYLPASPQATPASVTAAYQNAYSATPFVRLAPEPDTSHVRGSNFADVACDLDVAARILVARCAIDNLVKGGAGQAVQNMNLALGFSPAAGLPAVGGGP
ncbi:MAG: N-acetyl-gamma-glutamyl-phosphate reductase [Thermoplasmatota archaeon]